MIDLNQDNNLANSAADNISGREGLSSCEVWLDLFIARIQSASYCSLYAALLLFGLLIQNLSADPDLFARVAVGRLVEKLGYLPLLDPFAYTPKNPVFIDHEWLSGVVFWFIASNFSDFGLFAFKTIFAAVSLRLLISAMLTEQRGEEGDKNAGKKNAGRASGAMLVMISIVVVSSVYIWASTVRAQVFTYLFLPWLILALVRHRRFGELRWLVPFPAVMLVWCNAHGGFVVGLGLLLLYLFCLFVTDLKRAFLPGLIFVLSALATLINPYGVQYLDFIFKAVTKNRPFIAEWWSVSPLSGSAFLFYFIVAIFIYAFVRLPNYLRYAPERIVLPAAGLYFAFKHERLQAIFIMLAAAYALYPLRVIFAQLWQRFPIRMPRIARASAILILISSAYCIIQLLSFISLGSKFNLSYKGYPVCAVEWLKQKAQQEYKSTDKEPNRLLVNFNAGSFALWRLYPDYLVSMDGRYEEVYPDSTVMAVAHALNVESATFERDFQLIGADYILLDLDSNSAKEWHRYKDKSSLNFIPIYRDQSHLVLGVSSGISEDVEVKSDDCSFIPKQIWRAGF